MDKQLDPEGLFKQLKVKRGINSFTLILEITSEPTSV